MKCRNHPERDAVATCVECGNFICEDCRTEYKGKNVCKICLVKRLEETESRVYNKTPVEKQSQSISVNINNSRPNAPVRRPPVERRPSFSIGGPVTGLVFFSIFAVSFFSVSGFTNGIGAILGLVFSGLCGLMISIIVRRKKAEHRYYKKQLEKDNMNDQIKELERLLEMERTMDEQRKTDNFGNKKDSDPLR